MIIRQSRRFYNLVEFIDKHLPRFVWCSSFHIRTIAQKEMLGGKVAAMQARLDLEKQCEDAMNQVAEDEVIQQEVPPSTPNQPPIETDEPPKKKRKVRAVKQKQSKMTEEPVHENLRVVLLVRFNNDEKAMEEACFGVEEAMEGFEFYGEIGVGEQMLESTHVKSKKQSVVVKQLYVVWARMNTKWDENEIKEQVALNNTLLEFEESDGKFTSKESNCVTRYGIRRISDDARYEFPLIYRRIKASSHLQPKKKPPLAGP